MGTAHKNASFICITLYLMYAHMCTLQYEIHIIIPTATLKQRNLEGWGHPDRGTPNPLGSASCGVCSGQGTVFFRTAQPAGAGRYPAFCRRRGGWDVESVNKDKLGGGAGKLRELLR